MNLKIKFSESFRPFAPAVLREDVDEILRDAPSHENSPYMLLVAPVKPGQAPAGRRRAPGESVRGLEKLKELRSTVPAITHVDYSARVQTIDERSIIPRFHKILTAFKARTGSPVVINTSFNVRGEPIVNTPQDAYRCFMNTNMDVLVLENCHPRLKEPINPTPQRSTAEAYLAEFALD